MSAPDPEKWKTTEKEWDDMFDRWGYHAGGDYIESVINAVARRRALEELRAMATELLLMGLRPDGPHLLEIHSRIAEIEAEEP